MGSFVVSDGEAVVIYHYLKQDVLVMHVFPRSHKRWLESLNKWGLMYIQRGKYHLTEAGKAVLKAYKENGRASTEDLGHKFTTIRYRKVDDGTDN